MKCALWPNCYVSDGMIPPEGDRERLVKMPGRNLHSYRETALAG